MLELPSEIPLQRLENGLTRKKDVALFTLRLDTIDHYAGGNKLFKLKYNLEEAKKRGYKKLLTFGGAWSNHLAAVAAAASDFEVIAVVRGEEPAVYSDTLRFCKEKGVQPHFVSREMYRLKDDPEFLVKLQQQFGDIYILPEGGTNELAVKGCRGILNYVKQDFDFICCPVGSGGTIAGITSGLKEKQKALGFVALKGGEYLEEVILKLARIPLLSSAQPKNELFSLKGEKFFELHHEYHFSGFARATPELLRFKRDFENDFGFELDYVYTAKMFYGILDLLKRDYFPKNSTVIAIHTGGLQGNKGFRLKGRL